MGQINKIFANSIHESSKDCGFSPLFVTALTCLESDWGKTSVLSCNIFGERADASWKGNKKLLRVTEVHHSTPKLLKGEIIISRSQLNKNTEKFIILRWYKDYDSIHDCLVDHLKVFNEFPEAMKHSEDPYLFSKLICKEPFVDKDGNQNYKRYDSLENYPYFIESMYKTLLKLGIK